MTYAISNNISAPLSAASSMTAPATTAARCRTCTKPQKRILAADTARDLTNLLATTHLQPPYLLVAHSYGGIILRTFFQLQIFSAEEPVKAILLFDTATELMLQLFPRVPPLALVEVGGNVDVAALTNLPMDSGFSDEEWKYAVAAEKRCTHALGLEDTHASAHALALHRQLDGKGFGQRPLTVVQCNMAADYQFLYDEVVKLGNGSEEERRAARNFIETWRLFHGQIASAQCGLSTDARMRVWGNGGMI
ncbi:hypothetical protein EJ02DRAFT_464923 [Clathrospora elynae]|uniref:AB hydrolase-1 domain-containing protein n=1 Tax=Clathrospora elynae TaxID=706981 RepID=A0A6A5STT9_9PLEO|nr:hypothetical protein EJ02DRAFT_464923 [Clathrospora elynae]